MADKTDFLNAAAEALGSENMAKLISDAESSARRSAEWRRLMITEFAWPVPKADEALDLARHALSKAMKAIIETAALGSEEIIQNQITLMAMQLVVDACESTISFMKVLDPSIGVAEGS